jgi:hypothetical protein
MCEHAYACCNPQIRSKVTLSCILDRQIAVLMRLRQVALQWALVPGVRQFPRRNIGKPADAQQCRPTEHQHSCLLPSLAGPLHGYGIYDQVLIRRQ